VDDARDNDPHLLAVVGGPQVLTPEKQWEIGFTGFKDVGGNRLERLVEVEARAPFDPVEPPTEDAEDLYATMRPVALPEGQAPFAGQSTQPAPFEIQAESPMNAVAERLVSEGRDVPEIPALPPKGEGELF
jgi:hypothetical protein